jgi:cysteinyl-tRNA synthetase
MANDLDMPIAMSIMWEMAKDRDLTPQEKLALIKNFDQVLAFGVEGFSRPELSPELKELVEKREMARKEKNWGEADLLRNALVAKGLQLMDTAAGTDWYYIYKD